MTTAPTTLGLISLPFFALAANLDCAASGSGGAGGAGGAGGFAPITTTVQVTVEGVGEVDATGKTLTVPCARDATGKVTGSCSTGWIKGDPPLLVAKATAAGWTFKSWVDPTSGMTLSTMGQLQVAEGSLLHVNALFMVEGAASSSSSGCMGMGCGCVNNVCPEVVATGLDSVANLQERGTDLYYLDTTIDKLAKIFGKPAATIVGGSVGSFTVDDTNVYWTDGTNASLFKANLDGTGTIKLSGLDSMQYPHALAVDGNNVYITMLVNHGMGNCTAVMAVPKSAGGVPAEVSSSCDFLDMAKPYAIALNGTDVFWGTILMPTGGSLYSAPKTGNAVPAKALASNANSPVTRIAADDTSIFYLQNGLRMIDAKSPGMPTQVGTTMVTITNFAIDANDVFVAGGAGISKVDRMTQNETLLANEPGSTIAVDATHAYWATGSPGAVQILKIAK
jgi:hypothetical protein